MIKVTYVGYANDDLIGSIKVSNQDFWHYIYGNCCGTPNAAALGALMGWIPMIHEILIYDHGHEHGEHLVDVDVAFANATLDSDQIRISSSDIADAILRMYIRESGNTKPATKMNHSNSDRKDLIGRDLWVKGALAAPSLDIGMALCTGVLKDQSQFRFNESKDRIGFPIGKDQIRDRDQVFLSENDLIAFLRNYNTEHWPDQEGKVFIVSRCRQRFFIDMGVARTNQWSGEIEYKYIDRDPDFPILDKKKILQNDIKIIKSGMIIDLVKYLKLQMHLKK